MAVEIVDSIIHTRTYGHLWWKRTERDVYYLLNNIWYRVCGEEPSPPDDDVVDDDAVISNLNLRLAQLTGKVGVALDQ